MIHYIEINKEKHPVRISYLAIKRAKEEVLQNNPDRKDISMEELMSGDIEIMEPLLFYGLKAGYYAEGKLDSFKFTREEAEFLLDECFWNFVDLVPKFFPQGENEKKQKTNNKIQNKKTTPKQSK